LDAEFPGTAAYDRARRFNRFLHHVAQCAGTNHATLARHADRLDRQQIAADFGPREADHLADLIILFCHAEIESAHAEELVEVLRGDDDLLALFFEQQHLDDLAADLGDVALQRTHPRLTRVIADDVTHGPLGHADFFFLQTIVLD